MLHSHDLIISQRPHLLIPPLGLKISTQDTNIQFIASDFPFSARKTPQTKLNQVWKISLAIFFKCGRVGHKQDGNDHKSNPGPAQTSEGP